MFNGTEIKRFMLIFRGKSNTYVKNELPLERPEIGQKTKTHITSVEGSVDDTVIQNHLEGYYGVGVCPVNAEGKCFFGVIDIDYYRPKINLVLEMLMDYQIPLVPFRSKSGGLHLYFFSSSAINARTMRDALANVVNMLSLEEIYGKGKVEIFPKQDKATGFGSAVTLPYFNAEDTYTPMLTYEGVEVEFHEALKLIRDKISTIDKLKESLDSLPYNDAPPCIQRILNGHLVGGEDTGRNNFLFSYSVYAKKKFGSVFDTNVREINDGFECPIDDSEVDTIVNSVSENEYLYKCKDIPCSSFCDKRLCRTREFGLGRDKGHFTGIDYGQLYRYNASEPYYVWKLRLHGTEAWKEVQFKDEGCLLDQKNFAKMCIRYLNQAPMTVSANDWNAVLNTVLPNIEEVKVDMSTDTSATAMLYNMFIQYLSNKTARNDRPHQIRTGLCVRQSALVNGERKYRYYFTNQGFIDYLRARKVQFDMSMLREMLISFGAVEDVLSYVNTAGEPRMISCWSKVEDNNITDMYESMKEVEIEDKNMLASVNLAVTDADNKEHEEVEVEKPYSDEDLRNAEDLF